MEIKFRGITFSDNFNIRFGNRWVQIVDEHYDKLYEETDDYVFIVKELLEGFNHHELNNEREIKLTAFTITEDCIIKFYCDWLSVYDENGNEIYCEFDDGCWYKFEYVNGIQVYSETSKGVIFDNRVKKSNY